MKFTVKLIFIFCMTLAISTSALAQDTAPTPGFLETFLGMLPLFLILFLIIYFIIIKPQNAKLREHRAFIAGMQKGQAVVTSGGILGRVASIEDDYIAIDTGNNQKIKVQKFHVHKREETKTK
jgi:preprotein translocase subunit YajC